MNAEADAASSIVQVVAAVILRDDGQFLLARRPAGKVYAGYWEFPGGKVEPGEALTAALARELREELGIEVRRAFPWITQRFVYPHAHVQLNFFRVTQWDGVPHPHEDQVLSWSGAENVSVGPILPANGPVLRALALPPRMGITNADQVGIDRFLPRLDDALKRGLRLVMVREPTMPPAARRHLAEEVVRRCRHHGARVVLHEDMGYANAADGVHLTARQLRTLSRRPAAGLCGASCHDASELAMASALGLDYAVLGAVLPTPTHPGDNGLGWSAVGRLLAARALPVYLIGGMHDGLLEQAWERGAHGIAMIRHAWGDA